MNIICNGADVVNVGEFDHEYSGAVLEKGKIDLQ